jgi:predicted RNA polymerase sigma factor
MGKANGAAAGLALLAQGDIDTSAYSYVHLVRGVLLQEAGHVGAAAAALGEAARSARNRYERRQIEEMLAELRKGQTP